MESEIEGLINEGWKPRIKKKKNRRYITLRKGNKEKSLGPYTDELWEKVKPIDPWATPSQLSKLEKRIINIEKKQRRQTTDFNAVIFNRVKQLEESRRGANTSFDALLLNFEKMQDELLLSASYRILDTTACKHMDKNGVCNHWFYTCSADRTPENLRPMKKDEYQGKTIYRIRVREHPLVCSACPSYERERASVFPRSFLEQYQSSEKI